MTLGRSGTSGSGMDGGDLFLSDLVCFYGCPRLKGRKYRVNTRSHTMATLGDYNYGQNREILLEARNSAGAC